MSKTNARGRVSRTLGVALLLSFHILIFPTSVRAQGEVWRVSSKAVLSIGDADTDEEYTFHSIGAGQFLSDNRIVVADRRLLEIRIYAPNGRFLSRMGGRGGGPGEFEQIDGVWITPSGSIAAWDSRSRRITMFTAAGKLERTRTLGRDPPSGRPVSFAGAFDDGDILLITIVRGPRSTTPFRDRLWLSRYGSDGELKGSLGELSGMSRISNGPIPLTPSPVILVHRDTVFLVDDYRSDVKVRNAAGQTLRRFSLPVENTQTPKDALFWLQSEARRLRKESTAMQWLDSGFDNGKFPAPDSVPQLAGLLSDDRGYLWVKTYDVKSDAIWVKANALDLGTGGAWRVFTPAGRLVARVRVPPSVRPLLIKDNRLMGVSIDNFGVERLVVHSIER